MIDVPAIERRLSLDGWSPVPEQEWLAESWRTPSAFWKMLREWHDAGAPVRLESAPPGPTTKGGFDLFHDLVLRNLDSAVPAFCWYEPDGTARALSYRELAKRASLRAGTWQEAGLERGKKVAIVRTLDVELLVSTLAAVKLGACFSIIEPEGRRLVRARLEALAPDGVDLGPMHAPFLPEGVVALPPDGTAETLETSRSTLYEPGEVVAAPFDPTSEEQVPRQVTADSAWVQALADGPIALGLRRGDAFAAPGFPLAHTQPPLLWAGLLAGATFWHLRPEELEREPSRAVAHPLRTFGVDARVRELFLRQPVAAGGVWASWFRAPEGTAGLEPWQQFVRVTGLAETPALNLDWRACLGGCALYSPRRRGAAHHDVFPAPGVRWSLRALGQPEVESLGGSGQLARVSPGGDAAEVTSGILIRRGQAWMLAGTLSPGRRGMAYPQEMAAEVAKGLEGVRDGLVVLVPTASQAEPSVVWLLFTGPSTVDEGELVARARDVAEHELGRAFVPDRVECVPLVPRRDEAGACDARWCREAHVSGALTWMSKDVLFRAISELRAQLPFGEARGTP